MSIVLPSGDPLADFDRWDAEQAKQEAKLPKCSDCGEPIQDDYYYLINDECICPDCLDCSYRKNTEDFIE